MKSCHTRMPSSSHRSWNAAVSYAPVPGRRSMFMPALRTRLSSVRSSSSEGASPTGSIGVQTAPRANTRTPLMCRSSPSRSMS